MLNFIMAQARNSKYGRLNSTDDTHPNNSRAVRPLKEHERQDNKILYHTIFNEVIISYLELKDFLELPYVSRNMYFHLNFRNNPFWMLSLKPQSLPMVKSPGDAFPLFVHAPALRIDRYIAVAANGKTYVTQKLQNYGLTARQLKSIFQSTRLYNLTLNTAVSITKLSNDVIPIERIEALLRGGRTAHQIKKITAVDLVKFSYSVEARSRARQLGRTVCIFALAGWLKYLTTSSTHTLQVALNDYEGNTPIRPNRLTSLIFTDFCDAMSSFYDVSNCWTIAYQYEQEFLHYWLQQWLFLLSIYAALSNIVRWSASGFNAECGFKQSVIWHYLLPTYIASHLIPLAGNAPLTQAAPVTDRAEVSRLNASFVVGISCNAFFGIIATFTIVALSALITLNYQIDATPVHNLVNAVCVNSINANSVWSECMQGKYNTSLMTTQAINTYCSDICTYYANPTSYNNPPGEISLFITSLIEDSGLVSAITFLLLFPWCLGNLCGLYSIANKHCLFANSIHPSLLTPGQSDEKDDAIAQQTSYFRM